MILIFHLLINLNFFAVIPSSFINILVVFLYKFVIVKVQLMFATFKQLVGVFQAIYLVIQGLMGGDSAYKGEKMVSREHIFKSEGE